MGFSIFAARLGLPVKDEDGPEGIFTNRKAVEAHQFTIWPFGQTVSGHFFPNGGYHAGQNMVLILDVVRFKYPLHWIPLQLILEAMNTTDNST
uniref:glutathione gamma-glutamylcysteinyltransferase n=1 Tax=Zea mays TaxID=4577 RepID=A0A804PIW5_MAIZE